MSSDGSFLVCSFEEGGECTRINAAKFVNSDSGPAGVSDDLTPVGGAGAGASVDHGRKENTDVTEH